MNPTLTKLLIILESRGVKKIAGIEELIEPSKNEDRNIECPLCDLTHPDPDCVICDGSGIIVSISPDDEEDKRVEIELGLENETDDEEALKHKKKHPWYKRHFTSEQVAARKKHLEQRIAPTITTRREKPERPGLSANQIDWKWEDNADDKSLVSHDFVFNKDEDGRYAFNRFYDWIYEKGYEYANLREKRTHNHLTLILFDLTSNEINEAKEEYNHILSKKYEKGSEEIK